MNPKDDQQELLNDLSDDVASSDYRQTVLASTLQAAKGRRRRRQLGLAAALVAPLLLLLRPGTEQAPPDPIAKTTPFAPVVQVAHTQTEANERLPLRPTTISDDELFAMFPEYALALVGSSEDQRLVVLGKRAD